MASRCPIELTLALALLAALAIAPIESSAATKKKTKPASSSRSSAAKKKSTARSRTPARENLAPAATPAPPLVSASRPVPELPPGELPLLADGAIVLDGYTGKPLYEKNADLPLYPASTTKVLTALLIIEEGNLEKEIEVTEEDARVGESGLDIKPGDRFTRLQGLYGLMLKSANDVAHCLGRDNAGTAEAFAEKMTRRAHELGAVSSFFANAHGLHHSKHHTTARDLALITRAAMQQPLFRRIVATRTHPWEVFSTGPRELFNHNRLLGRFPGCTGVKTGFTNPAQHTLTSAALWGCREMIAAVLHSTKQGKYDDSMLLLTYAHSQPPQDSESAPEAAPAQTVSQAAQAQ